MAYATLKDIFLRWGETNVRDAANVNGDKPKSAAVTNRIKYFLQTQSDEIEARLRGCAYKVPFDPVPPVIRTLCVELAYIQMYRVRHSTDATATDPFQYVTARHNQIFADIHARRFRLGAEQHTVDVPIVVGGKKPTAFSTKATPPKTTPCVPIDNLSKIYTDGTLQGNGTKNDPLSVVGDLPFDMLGIDVSHIPDGSFVAIGVDGLAEASVLCHNVIGFKSNNTIYARGIVRNDHWNWEVGKHVMLGNDGLTQTAGDSLVRVGIALTPQLVILKFEYGFL